MSFIEKYPKVRCVAHSSQTGEPCKRWASRGSTVCTTHGARAPQVKRAAEERLAEMVDPALDTLLQLLIAHEGSVRLGAVKDILDRAGYKPKEKIDGKMTVNVVYADNANVDLAETP